MTDTQATAVPGLTAQAPEPTGSARELLSWADSRFGLRVAVACSFQKEASVIMDMLASINSGIRFFTLDTGVLFAETYETWRRLEQRYNVTVESFQGMSLARQAALHGDRLWERDPDGCCGIRKVEPLKRALSGLDCWISGLRRDQSPQRAHTPKFHYDARHGLWKLNPLADWSERDVWAYLIANRVPYNPLHDDGYASIGCTHCTVAASGREGRWQGQSKTECGLHG